MPFIFKNKINNVIIMELRKIVPIPKTPAYLERLEKERKQKAEASKSFGDFLINISNICFDRCISTDNLHLTKREKRCVDFM